MWVLLVDPFDPPTARLDDVERGTRVRFAEMQAVSQDRWTLGLTPSLSTLPSFSDQPSRGGIFTAQPERPT